MLREENERAEPSFDGTDYAIVPGPTTSSDAIEAVMGLARSVGASPFFLDPAEHDSFVMATEYLPRIAAGAAVDAASASPVWRDMRRLRGDAFSRALRTAAELDSEELAVALEYAPETFASWLGRLAGATSGLHEAALAKPDAAEAAKRLAALAEARMERLRESPAAYEPGDGAAELLVAPAGRLAHPENPPAVSVGVMPCYPPCGTRLLVCSNWSATQIECLRAQLQLDVLPGPTSLTRATMRILPPPTTAIATGHDSRAREGSRPLTT